MPRNCRGLIRCKVLLSIGFVNGKNRTINRERLNASVENESNSSWNSNWIELSFLLMNDSWAVSRWSSRWRRWSWSNVVSFRSEEESNSHRRLQDRWGAERYTRYDSEFRWYPTSEAWQRENRSRSFQYCLHSHEIHHVSILRLSNSFNRPIPSRTDCVLILTLATGGQLKYPVRFNTLDAPPDDEITLEAVGLNKTSSIGFRLYSPTEYVYTCPRTDVPLFHVSISSAPIAFQAYFTSNSDRSFSITPDRGDLLPASSNGTLLKISFCPTVYGRTFNGILIVEVMDIAWWRQGNDLGLSLCLDERQSMEIHRSWCVTSLWTTKESVQPPIGEQRWLRWSTGRSEETKFHPGKPSTASNRDLLADQRRISSGQTKWNHQCLKTCSCYFFTSNSLSVSRSPVMCLHLTSFAFRLIVKFTVSFVSVSVSAKPLWSH